MDHPLISIITPVYNTEKYLAECVDSVLRQSNPDWELILVDDGSTDASGSICDHYARMDSRIRAFHKDNSGQFDSRMLGILNASGEFCTGLDSDDSFEPYFVELVSNEVKKRQTDIICWNMRRMVNGVEIKRDMMPSYGEYNRRDFMKYVITSTNHSFCNKMIKTKLLKAFDFSDVPSHVRHSEDYILICPAICMADDIYALDSVLYNYRQSDKSVTHLFSANRVIDYMDSSDYIFKILEKYNMSSPDIEEAEYRVLIASVANGIKNAYKSGSIDNEHEKSIRNHKMFKRLKQYESTDYIPIEMVAFLKLFRYGFTPVLRIIYGVIKHE